MLNAYVLRHSYNGPVLQGNCLRVDVAQLRSDEAFQLQEPQVDSESSSGWQE